MSSHTLEGKKKTQNGVKHGIFSALAILLQAIFLINMLNPTLSVVLYSLLAAAIISLIIGTIVLAAIYLIRKLGATKE